jgi:hypothetical protein
VQRAPAVQIQFLPTARRVRPASSGPNSVRKRLGGVRADAGGAYFPLRLPGLFFFRLP